MTGSTFTVGQATLEDVPRVVEMEDRLFHDWKATKWIEGGRPERFKEIVRAKYEWHITHDPSATVVKITDDATGKIVAACMWHLYTTSATPAPLEPAFDLGLRDDDERQAFRHLVEYKTDLRAIREHYMKEYREYAVVVWLMVEPEYRRKGLATLLLNWGTDRADALGIPCILEASETGEKVYRQHGFVANEDFLTRMKDEGDDAPIVGGKVMIRRPKAE